MATPRKRLPGALKPPEIFWRDHQQWLEECGYLLRPRYSPEWHPSWQGTEKDWKRCEDGISSRFSPDLLDATRISDGKFVALKAIKKSLHPYEVEIASFLSSEALRSDPGNHCVPIYDVLQVPDDKDKVLLVMPLLRRYSDPRFDTIGEVVEFFRQIFEGLQYMHHRHVAHRDCMNLNIMMDPTPLYPEPYHPCAAYMKRDFSGRVTYYTRTERPPRYFFVDYGLSRRYTSQDSDPLEEPIRGGDKSAPEFKDLHKPCNPFPTDVYYLGNLIREDFLVGIPGFSEGFHGFQFMSNLVKDMVHEDPARRPTMDEVVVRFDAIRRGLSTWKLRSRAVRRDENSILEFFRPVAHWTRRVRFVFTGVPPMPAL